LRIVLTIIALLVISALTVALIGPYYVDWSKQREIVEAQFSRVLGQRVQIKGAIDVKLLPSPYITLNQVEVTSARTGDALFSCDKVELALGLASLVRGQLQFTQASFDRPTLDLARASDGAIALPDFGSAKGPDSIAFDSVIVREGRLRAIRPDGDAEPDLGGIDLEAQADSLSGPFKGSGSVSGPNQTKLAFSFATGQVEGSSLRLKAAVDPGGGWPHSEFDGALDFAAGSSTAGVVAVRYSGAATFSGSIAGAEAPTPWRASGSLKVDSNAASLDNLEIRVGPEDRALSANGSAEMQFGASPRASVVLNAKQFNFDALLREEKQDSVPPAKVYRAVSAALSAFGAQSDPPIAFSVQIQTPAAILGGDTIADLDLSAEASPGKPVGLRLEASPPGRSHIQASGVLDAGPASNFKGRVDIRIGDTQRLGEWLTADAPDLKARLASFSEVLPYRAASATGDVELSGAGLAMRNLKLVLERSTLAGTLVFTRSVGAERGRMFMDLQTDSLDVDALPNVSASKAFLEDMDLSLAIDAHAIRIVRLGEAEVEGGSLTLKLTKAGDDLRLDRLSIADLGGASVEASGASDAKGRWLTAKIDAARLRDFALLVRRVAPGRFSDTLVDRSGTLSPAKVTLSAQSSDPTKDVGDTGASVTVQGVAGVTLIDGKLDRAAAPDGELSANLSLDAPNAAPLLRQLGLPALSLEGQGRGHLALSARGRWSEGLETNVTASFAGSDIGWRGRLAPRATNANDALFAGSANFKAANAIPLLAVMAIAPSDTALVVPLELSADVTGREDGLDFAHLRGTLGRSLLTGNLALRPELPQPIPAVPANLDLALAQAVTGDDSTTIAPQLTGDIQVDRLGLSALTGLALGAPQPTRAGAPWSDLKFSAGLLNPPSADIALKIAVLDVTDSLAAYGASLRLKLGRGLVALDDLSMNVAGGALAGRAAIRRDGANASVSGQVSLEPVTVDRPYFAGQLAGSMDFASIGQSSGALVSGLAGTGQIRLAGARVPHLDQGALGRILDKAQSPDYAIDQTNVNHALEIELNKQPLRIIDAAPPASLTAGILRLGPFEARAPSNNAVVRADFDLRSLLLEVHAAFTESRVPKYWSGSSPAINIVVRGSIDVPAREVDSGLFVAGLAAQAIARETDRIAALESDIRERAFFNRRLKGGQFMRRRGLELESYAIEKARLNSEEDRRRVEVETLKADEERRKTPPPDMQTNSPPSSSELPPPATNTSPSSSPLPVPAPRPASPPRQADPTASGLY
jgi:AsmA family